MHPTIARSRTRTEAAEPPARAGSVELPGMPGRFCLYYQPEVALRDGSIRSCEALLRWWHPDFGMVRPGLSLPGTRFAERIHDLEDWTLGEVCRQGAAWASTGAPIQIALNVTRSRLVGGRFLDSVEAALRSHGLEPSALALDVPFPALATDPVGLRRVTDGIAALGVGVVIDGVGAGASFDSLDTITADAWKVAIPGRDRRGGLHRSVGDALTRAHELGALAVAKQVEDADVLEDLALLGYDRAFGHAISPPVTAEALASILRREQSNQRPVLGRT
ncbi:EAL domain-containing protein [Aquihabitans sp. G128]|uniref:EAL domain-containing protein n=1 Tax=Aquihabitans sp. G128 TaxID=2849779 RepID=UPI001C23EDE8|nr:EAL domain-containing protein [Aquihabitans sp. G128]QXC60668.1 EAL domain-containing protein [Aquihabitans sp. G128]